MSILRRSSATAHWSTDFVEHLRTVHFALAGFSGDAIGQEVTLELGGRKWGKWPVAVMDLSEILSAYAGKIDGVLGLDFFQQFRVAVVDLAGKTITFR